MQVLNDGTMDYCRWNFGPPPVSGNIQTMTPQQFFQHGLAPIRLQLLQAHSPKGCASCAKMEQHGKVSGRQKQLLKTGIRTNNFVPTARNSAWHEEFLCSARQQGQTQQMPQDWQVHLGNHCNSACLFCIPEASSRLASHYQQLGLIDQSPSANWTNNKEAVESFVAALSQSAVKYLHFIGGETLITPVFRTILQQLVDQGLSRTITLGFTTNLTVWDDHIVNLLQQFQQVHLGLSVECLDRVNDYVRWPSQIAEVVAMLDQWRLVAQQHGWYCQLRTTPTCLSVANLVSVYDYAWQHGIPVESCNFLESPEFMRPTVLPLDIRLQIANHIQSWCDQRGSTGHAVINTRDPEQVNQQLVQDLASYCDYLVSAPDESHRLPALTQYLKSMDQLRQNSVFDYLPQYHDLFRSSGY